MTHENNQSYHRVNNQRYWIGFNPGYNLACMNSLADRLKLALSARNWTQDDLAQRAGLSQVAVHKLLTGKAVSTRKGPEIADALGIRLDWLLTGKGNMTPSDSVEERGSDYSTDGQETVIAEGDEAIQLPFFREAAPGQSASSRVYIDYDGETRPIARSVLEDVGVSPECAAWAIAQGNSMEPVVPDGTKACVNTGETSITDGRMYAVDHAGMLRIKLLYRLPGNGLRLKSYNSSEWPDENLTTADAESVRVLGRVFWYVVRL